MNLLDALKESNMARLEHWADDMYAYASDNGRIWVKYRNGKQEEQQANLEMFKEVWIPVPKPCSHDPLFGKPIFMRGIDAPIEAECRCGAKIRSTGWEVV